MDAPLRARSYVPLALQATGTGAALSLFAAQGVAATAPQTNGARSDSVPLVRLKRKADAEVKTISVERSTKKALHEELAALAVAEKQASGGNAATSASPATTPQRKLYRRVASYSARSFQNAQGAENLLERIYIKNEEVAQREAGRTSLRRRQDAQRERAKQQQTASHRQQGSVQPTLPVVEAQAKALPVSAGKHPTRAELEAQEKHIIMNCMPLVREYLQIERQKAEENAKKKLAVHLTSDAEMGKMLDEYEVEVFEAVPDGVVMTDAAVAEAVNVTLAPFEDRDPLVYDHELDSSEDENGDEEDSNDEDHPNNDYPDDPEDDSDAEKDSDASSEEDVWAAPSRRERFVQDVDDDD